MNLNININGSRKINMKVFVAVALSIFAISNVAAAPKQLLKNELDTTKTKAKFVEGEILIRYKSNVSTQDQKITAASFGARSSAQISKKMKVTKVKLQLGDDVTTAVQMYQNDPNIEYAQPNYIYYPTAIPNDTSFTQLWGLKNTGQTVLNPTYATNNPGTAGNDIDAESAWDQITDCRSAVVAVLDTGINYTHQDLAANMWDGSGAGFPNHGYDFIDVDNDPMPTSGNEYHGTHVAGIIGAVGNNSSGVTGICWQASIMSVRVLSATGGTTSTIVQGIEFAADRGASVINMSLGSEVALDLLFEDAITYANTNDVVVVVAAGNGGADGLSDDNDGLGDDGIASTKTYPCNFSQDNLLCVAALDQSYSLTSYSNYGATSVDIGAPGANILSSFAGQSITDDFTSGWTLGGGWGASVCSTSTATYAFLSNPSNWCGGGTYASNADDRAYKSFNLAGANSATISYIALINTELNFDYISTAMKSTGGDPFIAGNTLLNTSGGISDYFIHDISACNTSTCSLGFRLTSNGSIVNAGVGIVNFVINTLETNSTRYYPLDGTSMASPQVAGIAAMVRAFNPNYTYAHTVAAIKNGGESVAALSGITTTGRSANAMGALSYISEPTGVVASVL